MTSMPQIGERQVLVSIRSTLSAPTSRSELQLLIAQAAFRCEVSFSCAARNAAMWLRDIVQPTSSRPR